MQLIPASISSKGMKIDRLVSPVQFRLSHAYERSSFMRILTNEEKRDYPYCLEDNFVLIRIGKYTCRCAHVRDETCVYHITPEPDEEGLELIRNSQ